MQDGQQVTLSLSHGTTLTARCLGSGSGVDVMKGTRGVVMAVLDVYSRGGENLAAVKFQGQKSILIVPFKYLAAA